MAGIVFGVFCTLSVLCAVLTGNTAEIGNALFSGIGDAVTLMLSLGGAMCFWGGILEVLREVGVLRWLERVLSPLLARLFDMPDNADAGHAVGEGTTGLSEITASLSANLLGLGNAATPIGLRAMELLRQRRSVPDKMSNAEILFVVLNTAPPTLLPTALLTMRHAAGSVSPTAVLPAIWGVSLLGCVFAAVVTRGMEHAADRRR